MQKGSDHMAAVNYSKGKCHGPQETSALLRHADPSPENRKRVLGVKRSTGQACDINTEMSHLNYTVFMVDIDKAESCNATCLDYYPTQFRNYKYAINALDGMVSQTNKRRDRVTCQFLEIPFPKELSGTDPETYARGQAWAKRVVEVISETYREGEIRPLLLYAAVHVDEIHDYIDADTGEQRTSVVHMHLPVIPFNPHTRRLSGKWFSSRAKMTEVNNAIQKMTRKEFGCDFMTGTKKKSGETVEELKARSRKAIAEIDYSRRNYEKEKREFEKRTEELKKVMSKVDTVTEEILRRLAEEKNKEHDMMDEVFGFCQACTKEQGFLRNGKSHWQAFNDFHESHTEECRRILKTREELLENAAALQDRICSKDHSFSSQDFV